MNRSLSTQAPARRRGFATLALAALVGAVGLGGSALVHAQSTAGVVFGNAPAGDTVTARSTINGTQREVHVASNGRYAIRALPVGVYDVILTKNDEVVTQKLKVPVIVGRSIKVDFACVGGGCRQASATSQQ